MLSFSGLVRLLGLPIIILIQVILQLITGKGPYRKYEKSILNSAKLTLFRTIIGLKVGDAHQVNLLSNSFQLNWLLPKVFKPIVQTIPGLGSRYDANALWIAKEESRSKSDPIVLYIHGGGFFIETAPSQLQSVVAIRHLLDPKVQKKTSFLLLDYKLASAGYPLPYQLNQLAATYKRLTEVDGNTNIVIMGDSAGGNLAIVLLQYLKQLKKPCVYPKSLVLISPWTKLKPDPGQRSAGRSYGDNEHRDMIQYSLGADMEKAKSIMGRSRVENLLISPNNVDLSTTHWEDVPTLSQPNYSVFLLCGEDESFRDDVLEWAHYALDTPLYNAHKYGDSNNKYDPKKHYFERNDGKSPHVRAFVEPWGIHDSCLFIENRLLKDIKKNPSLKLKDIDRDEYFGLVRITEFLNDTLSSD